LVASLLATTAALLALLTALLALSLSLARLLAALLLAALLIAWLLSAALSLLVSRPGASRTRLRTLSQSLQLGTQTLDLIDAFLRLLGLVAVFSTGGRHLLGVFQVVFELIQALRDGRFAHDRVRAHPLPDERFGLLHAVFNLILLSVSRRIAQLFGHVRLRARHGSGSRLHVFLQLRILFAHGSFLVRQLLRGFLVGISVGVILTHLLFQILLFRGQLFGLIRQIGHLGTSLLFRHVLQGLIRLAHLICRRLGISRGLPVIALAG
jgi:hypothetical protein